MPSYAVYKQTPGGMSRLGVFRTRYSSVRAVAAALARRYPNMAKDGMLFVAERRKLFGRYVDGDRLPLDTKEA